MNKTHKYFIKKQLSPQPPNNSAPTTPTTRVERYGSRSQHDKISKELHILVTKMNPEPSPTKMTPCLAFGPVVAMLSQRLDASLPITIPISQQQQEQHEQNEHAEGGGRGGGEEHLLRKNRREVAAVSMSDHPFRILISPCELAGCLLLLLLVSFAIARYCAPRNFYHNQIVEKNTKTLLHTKLVNSYYVLGITNAFFAFLYVCPVLASVSGRIVIDYNYLWVSFRWQGCGPRRSRGFCWAAACRLWQRLPSRLHV